MKILIIETTIEFPFIIFAAVSIIGCYVDDDVDMLRLLLLLELGETRSSYVRNKNIANVSVTPNKHLRYYYICKQLIFLNIFSTWIYFFITDMVKYHCKWRSPFLFATKYIFSGLCSHCDLFAFDYPGKTSDQYWVAWREPIEVI